MKSGDNCVWIAFEDQGGGIAQEAMEKIWDPFFTTKDKGTGLGLSIVSGIVKKHHGTIDVDSRAGMTQFRISLPVKGINGSAGDEETEARMSVTKDVAAV